MFYKQSRPIIALLLACSAITCAEDVVGTGCSVSATISARSGANWISGSIHHQIYDIVVTNTGSCPANSIGLNFAYSGNISESWNLVADSRYYMLSGFGESIPVGGMFNGVGFVLDSFTAQQEVGVTVYGVACPRSCSANPPAPTNTPTTAPNNTATASPIVSCNATATIMRDTSIAPWTDSKGNTVAVYRLALVNNGPNALKDFAFSLGFLPFSSDIEIQSTWNVGPSIGGYAVTGYGSVLPAGATYSGTGFTIANVGSAEIQVDVYGSNCVAA